MTETSAAPDDVEVGSSNWCVTTWMPYWMYVHAT